ncbi:glucan endo-1,3-beta-glucosidase 13 [Senna tora]|uniref:glucan endo-1,3-beta-D-glucosidase n=1 Tax=Senna tora TaxID=362788 RepID=A0A834W8C4_9FABA|nr:glucan endo-1,3-beta-glucosidase 13 [Senna tora]
MSVGNSVLAHYPASRITTIVVGNSVLLCQRDQQEKFGLILPSLKNVYHSLKRWGLEKEIKVSAPLYLDCLQPNSASFGDDLRMAKPVLEYLRSVNGNLCISVGTMRKKKEKKNFKVLFSNVQTDETCVPSARTGTIAIHTSEG